MNGVHNGIKLNNYYDCLTYLDNDLEINGSLTVKSVITQDVTTAHASTYTLDVGSLATTHGILNHGTIDTDILQVHTQANTTEISNSGLIETHDLHCQVLQTLQMDVNTLTATEISNSGLIETHDLHCQVLQTLQMDVNTLTATTISNVHDLEAENIASQHITADAATVGDIEASSINGLIIHEYNPEEHRRVVDTGYDILHLGQTGVVGQLVNAIDSIGFQPKFLYPFTFIPQDATVVGDRAMVGGDHSVRASGAGRSGVDRDVGDVERHYARLCRSRQFLVSVVVGQVGPRPGLTGGRRRPVQVRRGLWVLPRAR